MHIRTQAQHAAMLASPDRMSSQPPPRSLGDFLGNNKKTKKKLEEFGKKMILAVKTQVFCILGSQNPMIY